MVLKKTLCLILTILFIVPPCLIYYTVHFYFDRVIIFTNANFVQWIIIVLLILLSIILNLLQNHKITKLEYELFHYLQGNREIVLDIEDAVINLKKEEQDEPLV